ncbi:hypothetical protein UPYG_G00210180 [Umbra pygmaea]|uniref:Uncharacterized protein n=1 Tax=Umbra pygmaea TaxID=75934 RepID=A0ABD0WJL0_UMBPY
MNNKPIPATLLEHLCLPSFSSTYPTSLIPDEMFCHRCAGNVPLSDPLLITSKAKSLTITRIINDFATYCGMLPPMWNPLQVSRVKRWPAQL